MRSLAFFIFLTFILQSLSAQHTTFEGNVIDKITKEPVPYVHIFLTSGLSGTVSDVNGEFSIISGTAKNDSLRFTSIGYKAQKLALKKFNHKKITIELEEDRVLLPGVVIHDLSAKEFVRKCVANIPNSYSIAESNRKAFYWKSVRHENVYTDFYEAYLNLDKSKIQYDSTVTNIRCSGKHIQLFDSLQDILSFDVIDQASMFVNPMNLNDWKYEYLYSSEQPEGTFVVIEAEMIQNPFEVKTASNTLKIFIETPGYAIVRVDFSYNWQNGKRYQWKDDVLFTVSRLEGTVEYARNLKQKYGLQYLFIGTEFSFTKRFNPEILKKAFIQHELVLLNSDKDWQKPVVRWSDYLDATHDLNRGKPDSGQDQ